MDAKTNGALPAHPCEFDYINSNRSEACGLTKRELFAAIAMQGIVTNWQHDWFPENHAKFAVECADALLAALTPESAP